MQDFVFVCGIIEKLLYTQFLYDNSNLDIEGDIKGDSNLQKNSCSQLSSPFE